MQDKILDTFLKLLYYFVVKANITDISLKTLF